VEVRTFALQKKLNGGQGGIAFGYANLRFAVGMFCSPSSLLRSNPLLRRGSHPSLGRMVIEPKWKFERLPFKKN
jgi:hypothetical protein